jgi:perosamine synthetase
MPNLNAALACAQLEQLDEYVANKRETSLLYQEFFKTFDGIQYIKELKDGQSNYWLSAIRFNSESEKNAFLEFSNSNNVMARPIWKLMNHLSMFEDAPKGNLDIAEALEKTIVNIPSSVRL